MPHTSDGLERRVINRQCELRIVGGENGEPERVEGLAVPYNQLSEDLGGFVERIMPGAFGDSIRSTGDHDLRADVEHDQRLLLGRASKGTLEFRDSQEGLWAVITKPDTTLGNDTFAQVRNGNLDGMSIAWQRAGTEDRFLEEGGRTVREVLKAKLAGVTLTSIPAYRQTVDTLVMRSLETWRKEQDGESGDDGYDPELDPDNLSRRLDLLEAEGP